MLLSEKNIDEISLGLSVISAKGTPGKVTNIVKEEDNHKKEPQLRVRYDTINIDWETGNKSIVFHMQADSIKIKED